MNRIKRLSIITLAVCSLSSCAAQKEWRYSSFQKNPEYTLSQAQSICTGYAQNISKGAGNHRAKKTLNCASDGSLGYGSWNSNTSCYTSSNPIDELAAASKNIQAKRETFNNSYTSCLAQHGWNATLAKVSSGSSENYQLVKCRKPDGTVLSNKIMKRTCLSTHGGSVVWE